MIDALKLTNTERVAGYTWANYLPVFINYISSDLLRVVVRTSYS